MRRTVTETSERRRAAGRLISRSLVGATGGGALALAVAAIDRVGGLVLPLPLDHTQLLIGTLAGASVTVVVFALWMRTVVVGLLSDQVSPRIATGYLDDGFQRWLVTVGLGLITFLAVSVLALPDLDDGNGAPALTTLLAVLSAVVATGGVLWSVQVAVRDLSLPNVIRQVADQALAVLDLHVEADHEPPEREVGEDIESLTSETMGWITAVDRRALLEAVPADTTVTLEVDLGDFVATHQIIARVDTQLDDEAREQLLDAITVGRTRSPRHDIAFAIQPLVDIAEHAMGATSNDTSTAHEALVHLRAVLHEVLLRGPVTGWWTDGEGRWLRSARVREPVDHVTTAMDRLRAAATTAPMRADLYEVAARLRATAEGVGDGPCRDHLDEQLAALRADR